MSFPRPTALRLSILLTALACSACGSGRRVSPGPDAGPGADASTADASRPPFDAAASPDSGFMGDPVSCEHARVTRTYVGCDFWPTVLVNGVGEYFDYAVVVANASEVSAEVTVMRAGAEVARGSVPPNGLHTFFLPWVDELKHYTGMCDTDSREGPETSARAPGSAYHLVSSMPVTVYQFNPLEYGPSGGPPGKDWSACESGCLFGCNSYSNDASLLLPSTAAQLNYRITTQSGIDVDEIHAPGYFTVTGFQDGTQLAIQVSSTGQIIAGDDIPATGSGEILRTTVNRGEVLRFVGTPATDLAGTLVQSSLPIQVLAGHRCIYQPFDRQACDHLEESVFPAETLGQRYFVMRPSGPRGDAADHIVRLFGNVDGTALSYPAGAPSGAPAMINAGEVVDLGIVDRDFEVVGDHEFAVTTFMLGGSYVDPGLMGKGDPSQTNMAAVEQYRLEYVFLAPNDYDVSFADIIMPTGATVLLDGAPISATPSPIGPDFGVARVQLGAGIGGAHRIVANVPVGVQVAGYGFATSYHYPAGLNLMGIAPPPPDLI